MIQYRLDMASKHAFLHDNLEYESTAEPILERYVWGQYLHDVNALA